jgi:uncharacterized spore protein YtfJ
MKEIMESWRDTYTVRRIFGDPIEQDGTTVIPVAMMAGGCGGGTGTAVGADDTESGGGGFSGMVRPAGVYVLRGDEVQWQPAIDVTLLGMAVIALTALTVLVAGLVHVDTGGRGPVEQLGPRPPRTLRNYPMPRKPISRSASSIFFTSRMRSRFATGTVSPHSSHTCSSFVLIQAIVLGI